MKVTYSQLIKNELIKSGFDKPKLTISKISRTIENQELISLINRVLTHTETFMEREQILNKMRKLIIQTLRQPDEIQYQAEKAEFDQYLNGIIQEQEIYNPIAWIDAELNYLSYVKLQGNNGSKTAVSDTIVNDWVDSKEVMRVFGFARSTLNRRIGEGMPVSKIGGKKMFNCQKINEWLLLLQ